MKKALMEQDCT